MGLIEKVFRSLSLAVFLILTGCASSGSPTISPIPETSTRTPESSLTPEPPTPTALAPVGVFLASDDANPDIVRELKPLVSAWMEEEGFRFQDRESLSVEELQTESYRYIVAVSPQTNLESLVQASPESDFLAIGFSELEPQQNLSVVSGEEEQYDEMGFIAGYIAAMITPDWRVAEIGVQGQPAARRSQTSFSLGVRYFCGLCRPDHPPYYEYPLYVELLPGASSNEWRASADDLLNKGIETVYVAPGAGDEALLKYLVESGAHVIAPSDHYREELQEGWVASLELDFLEAFNEYWPDFVAGEVGEGIRVPLVIRDVNPDLLSPGRLENVQSVLDDVSKGWINPGPPEE